MRMERLPKVAPPPPQPLTPPGGGAGVWKTGFKPPPPVANSVLELCVEQYWTLFATGNRALTLDLFREPAADTRSNFGHAFEEKKKKTVVDCPVTTVPSPADCPTAADAALRHVHVLFRGGGLALLRALPEAVALQPPLMSPIVRHGVTAGADMPLASGRETGSQ